MAIKVEYQGGESRHGSGAVDYMLARAGAVELYAEAPADPADDTATYDALKADILRQAEAAGIQQADLQFYYD